MKLKQITLLIAAAIVINLFSNTAISDEALKIGFVEVERLRRESPSIQKEVKKNDRVIRNLQNQIEGMTSQYQRLRAEFDRKKSVYSEEQIERHKTELADLKKTIQDMQLDVREKMIEIDKDVFEPIIRKVAAITNTIAEEEGYDFILRGDSVLFGKKEHDLTEKVIDELEKLMQSDAETSGTLEAITEEAATPEEEK